ncbi:MAG: mechanosensitive ion channel family protein [Polyangiales bacterium]
MGIPWIQFDPVSRLFDDVGITAPVAAAAVLVLDLLLTSILARELKRALRLSVGLAWLYLILALTRCFTPRDADIEHVFRVLSAVSLAIALAQTIFVLVVDFVLGRNGRRPLRPMIRYALLGVAFLIASLAGLHAGGVNSFGVLASGAVVIGGVGAAVAEVLRQVGAGVLVQYSRPFEVGDVIQVLPLEQRGTVISTNWRTTTLRSPGGLEFLVPNNDMMTHTVINYGHGDRTFLREIQFDGAYDAPPESVRQAVLSSLRDVAGIEEHPPPAVLLASFGESGLRYMLRYWVKSAEGVELIDAEARTRIWYAFARAGLEFPFPTRTIFNAQRTDPKEQSQSRATRLKRTLLFSSLKDAAILDIALHGTEHPYGAGEVIVQAGEAGTTMHVILEGEVAVQAKDDRRELLKLAAGDFFGEMSRIPGAERAATVVAVVPTLTCVIDEAGFRAMVARHPEVAGALSDVLAARQNDLASKQEQREVDAQQGEHIRTAMMERIKRVFGLSPQKPT